MWLMLPIPCACVYIPRFWRGVPCFLLRNKEGKTFLRKFAIKKALSTYVNRAFKRLIEIVGYIIPPIPPIPGSGIAGIGGSFSGISVIAASVVKRRPAIDEEFSTAIRATFAGSIMPDSNI